MGFSQKDITPNGSVQTIGFGRSDEWSKGVLQPLIAQITVWKSNGGTCCLVAIDHIGFSTRHANFLRDEIGKLLSVARDKVMLCFSHTHAAPNESAAPAYFEFLCSQVKDGVADALSCMVPIRAAWGNASSDIGLNRRGDCEALDRRIGILKVCDANDDSLKLILLRLTAHNNVLKADNYLISPDYFGTVRDVLRAEYGCPVMVTQGASGNVAPRYYKADHMPPDACEGRSIRSDTALRDMAQSIQRDVAPVIETMRPRNIHSLVMYARQVSFISDVPTYDRALEVAEEARQRCGIDGTAWLKEVRRLLQAGTKEQKEEIEVQYFALDEGCLCGVAHEIMCEFALRASELLHNDFFYFGGYTNGCAGYFPTEEEFDQGGYEVYWSMLIYFIYYGRVFPLRRESAGALIQFAVENSPV